ncbi:MULTISPECIES: copper homeostasis membrane protein CopD [Sphingomonadaceae]|uniref:copper homeostasis membrane protein CopD n=1 Tax=Sphingomonadales TaxID=204457 RepID=UPI0022EDE296|nr:MULTISPECIES: copper homeostasis membrane protein CopD [Sphingomonadaceae]MDG5971617.1 copper homeostasis membrane protein CopD [Sphingomonas paucimobilis]GLI98236.1 copper resistance protein CopD [Sphingobium sp. BS19]
MDNLPVIAIRFALYVDLMVLAGVTAFSLYALKPEERGTALLPLAKPALLLSLLGLLLSGSGMIALVAAMTGTSLWEVDGSAFREIVTQSAIGSAWVVRMVAVAIALLAALALGRSPRLARYCLLASAVLAIATLVWTGHAGATEGWTGSLHRLSDIVHMLAAAIWIGGIAAFSWLLFQPLAHQSDAQIRIAHRALEQFSRVGTLAVALIVLTGIINSLSLMGLPHPYALFASRYGQLLLIKLALFAAMLMLAGVNRWRLTPALGAANGNPVPALRGLRQSLVLETSTVLTILAVVAWLGTLEPIMANG